MTSYNYQILDYYLSLSHKYNDLSILSIMSVILFLWQNTKKRGCFKIISQRAKKQSIEHLNSKASRDRPHTVDIVYLKV